MTSPLFKKLNLGSQDEICLLNAPATFETELAALKGVTVKRAPVRRTLFAMAFVITQAQLDAASRKLSTACEGDAVLWMVYPKKSSKKYQCDFHRDSGWTVLGAAGFEPVRMVAIDADWSALRFRRVAYIRTMRRAPHRALSPAGRSKSRAGKM